MVAYHELCEIDAGDIAPAHGVPKEKKFERERACVERLAVEYNMPEVLEFWTEFETGNSPEAQFVRMIDKYDALRQADVYAKAQNRPDVYNDFRESYRKITHLNEFIEHVEKL